jgi:hypothetical protein
MKRLLVVAVAVLSSLCWADIGKISTVEGEATRTPKGGAAVALAAGSAIELGDVITVKTCNLKLELTDGSIIALSPASSL